MQNNITINEESIRITKLNLFSCTSKTFFSTTNPSVFQTVFYELGTFQILFTRTHSGLRAGNVSKLIKIHGDQLSKAPD